MRRPTPIRRQAGAEAGPRTLGTCAHPTSTVAWREVPIMFIGAIVLLALGFLLYLGAFAQGPGPSMSDRPLQAWMFFAATAFMVTGFLLFVV